MTFPIGALVLFILPLIIGGFIGLQIRKMATNQPNLYRIWFVCVMIGSVFSLYNFITHINDTDKK